MVKLLRQTELKMDINSEPFGVREWLMQNWKQKIELYNMHECDDFKIKIQKSKYGHGTNWQ